jgi:peptide/nickel transport system substrate-binding protein
VGTPLKLLCNANVAFNREIGQVVQEMWNSVGFKVSLEQGEFDSFIGGGTYRFDPDDFFGRNFHSKSDLVQVLSGWQNARYDQLVEEAKRTLNPARRKELYTEAWNIVNVELPHFHLHEVTQTAAAAKELQGYQPNVVGALTYRGGGIRTAYIKA